jgi:uncharacterized membrane protein YeaQ/YmgE (transglycosylase-associated protein family)
MDLFVVAAIASSVGWIGWLVIGASAGALAGRVMRGGGFGLLGDRVVGMVGAFLGGWLLGMVITADLGLGGSLVLAFLGACLLLFLVRLVRGGRGAFSR